MLHMACSVDSGCMRARRILLNSLRNDPGGLGLVRSSRHRLEQSEPGSERMEFESHPRRREPRRMLGAWRDPADPV